MSAAAAAATLCPSCETLLIPPASCGTGPGASCGAACGSRGGCALLSCPGCGRSWPHPGRSRLAFRLARWLARRNGTPRAAGQAVDPATPAANGAHTLAGLPPGRRARIEALRCATPERLHQLTALGLVPGTELHLQRRRPTFVVQVDQTTLALDAQVAGEIHLAGGD